MVIASVSTASQTKWSWWWVQYFKFSPWRQKILDIKCSLRLLETKFTRRITRDQVVTSLEKFIQELDHYADWMRSDLLQLQVTSILSFTFLPWSHQLFSNTNFLKLISIVDEGTGNLTNLCISHPPCPLYEKLCCTYFFFHVNVAHAISAQSFYIKRNTKLVFNGLLQHCRKRMNG